MTDKCICGSSTFHELTPTTITEDVLFVTKTNGSEEILVLSVCADCGLVKFNY